MILPDVLVTVKSLYDVAAETNFTWVGYMFSTSNFCENAWNMSGGDQNCKFLWGPAEIEKSRNFLFWWNINNEYSPFWIRGKI